MQQTNSTLTSSTESYEYIPKIKKPTVKRVCIKKTELRKRGYVNFEDWKAEPSHLYIGRNMSFYFKGANESVYHNPYGMSDYTPEESLEYFRVYAKKAPFYKNIENILTYKEIGCWCEKDEQCHGDVLIELALEKSQGKN